MADSLATPFGPPPLFLIIAIGLLIILALWLGWRISKLREQPHLTPVRIRTWQAKIDDAIAGHHDPRVAALTLAKVLRDYGTERWGVPMASMTVSEIEAGREDFARLLRQLEEPSFSPFTSGEVERIADEAKGAVGSW